MAVPAAGTARALSACAVDPLQHFLAGFRLVEAGGLSPALDDVAEVADGDKPMLGFETITLCPFDRRLIETALLSADETAWLNAYHARVREALTPHLDKEDSAWLKQETKKL